jgi:hypothetical protein
VVVDAGVDDVDGGALVVSAVDEVAAVAVVAVVGKVVEELVDGVAPPPPEQAAHNQAAVTPIPTKRNRRVLRLPVRPASPGFIDRNDRAARGSGAEGRRFHIPDD